MSPARHVLTPELYYRVAGSGGSWTQGTLTQLGNRYTANVSALSTDQYEYEVRYTKTGESSPAAVASGRFSVNNSGSGSHVVGAVDRSDYMERLILSGNTASITGVSITGVGTLSVNSLGGDVYEADLMELAPGTYQYTVLGHRASAKRRLKSCSIARQVPASRISAFRRMISSRTHRGLRRLRCAQRSASWRLR